MKSKEFNCNNSDGIQQKRQVYDTLENQWKNKQVRKIPVILSNEIELHRDLKLHFI